MSRTGFDETPLRVTCHQALSCSSCHQCVDITSSSSKYFPGSTNLPYYQCVRISFLKHHRCKQFGSGRAETGSDETPLIVTSHQVLSCSSRHQYVDTTRSSYSPGSTKNIIISTCQNTVLNIFFILDEQNRI